MAAEQERHLEGIIESFSTGVLVTRAPDGGMHARPLAVAPDPQRKEALRLGRGLPLGRRRLTSIS
jgi:hypothetical protein